MLEAFTLTNGHAQIVAAADQAADHLLTWFSTQAADGFVVFPAQGVRTARLLVDVIVPRFRSLGLFREEYEGSTLRDHFGLPPLVSDWEPTDADLRLSVATD